MTELDIPENVKKAIGQVLTKERAKQNNQQGNDAAAASPKSQIHSSHQTKTLVIDEKADESKVRQSEESTSTHSSSLFTSVYNLSKAIFLLSIMTLYT